MLFLLFLKMALLTVPWVGGQLFAITAIHVVLRYARVGESGFKQLTAASRSPAKPHQMEMY